MTGKGPHARKISDAERRIFMPENQRFMPAINAPADRMINIGLRLMILLFTAWCSPSSAADADSDFSGAWAVSICPAKAQRDPGKCSNFVIELFQKQNKLCGAHIFATAGAAQLDEGGAPSLTGTIGDDGTASVMVESGRAAPPVKMRVELKLVNGLLQWRRLDNPEGDYLLPRTTQLTKSRHGTLFSPLFGQRLKAVCSAMSNAAADNSVPQPARPAPPQ
jgi:hypothetical protein